MATERLVSYIAVCDVCGLKFDEPNEIWLWDDTPELAIDQIRCAMPDTDWRIVGDDTVVCAASDTAHYLARGSESPALLKPGSDAMTVRYTAPLASHLIAEGDAA